MFLYLLLLPGHCFHDSSCERHHHIRHSWPCFHPEENDGCDTAERSSLTTRVKTRSHGESVMPARVLRYSSSSRLVRTIVLQLFHLCRSSGTQHPAAKQYFMVSLSASDTVRTPRCHNTSFNAFLPHKLRERKHEGIVIFSGRSAHYRV